MKTKIKVILIEWLLFSILILGSSFHKPQQSIDCDSLIDTTLNSGKMYFYIEKYCEQYDVPKHMVYNMAFKESSYKGPLDSTYKHNLVSSTGALGPMQIVSSTANFIMKKKIDKYQLRNNIALNIEVSVKLLSYLHNQYNNWLKVGGCYNTGRPIVNGYAKYVVNNLDYKNKWE